MDALSKQGHGTAGYGFGHASDSGAKGGRGRGFQKPPPREREGTPNQARRGAGRFMMSFDNGIEDKMGRRNRPPVQTKLDMTPVERTSHLDSLNFDKPNEEPFVWEPHPTDLPKQAMELIKEANNQRQYIKDEAGNIMFDCRDMHPYTMMCQFCDGRRGPWTTGKNAGTRSGSDDAFKRYQDGIIQSGMNFRESLKGDDQGQFSRDIDADFGVPDEMMRVVFQ